MPLQKKFVSDIPQSHDVIILGGGPGGISAAIWAADLGLQPLLIEQEPSLGGQMLWTHNPITNYPGVSATRGRELAELFAASMRREDIGVISGVGIIRADLDRRQVELADGRSYEAEAIVIATGIRRRRLGVPGETEFADRGILRSGAGQRHSVAGKAVAIVGGGDAALENALILSEYAAEVIVIHRRGEFSARREFVDEAGSRVNVRYVMDSTVISVNGSERLTSLTVDSAGTRSEIPCEALLIRIGVEANTGLFRDQVACDAAGYVVVDKECRTSRSGVWAVGDVTGPTAMTIANAVGQGSVAAKSILASL